MSLSNRHYLITGAGSGIGRAIACHLDAAGATISLFGRRQSALEETVKLLKGTPHIAPLDITDRESVRRAFDLAAKENGPVHGLIANAGVGGPNGPDDPEGDRFDELIDVNLRGTYHCVRAAERLLAGEEQGARHMVVISSILARIGVPGYSGYCASKTALLGLVRSLAVELAPVGIRVNAICPGWVDTDMAWDGLDGMAKAMDITRQEAHGIAMQDVPVGRMGDVAEIAKTVAFLLSPGGDCVVGAALDVNGGAYMA